VISADITGAMPSAVENDTGSSAIGDAIRLGDDQENISIAAVSGGSVTEVWRCAVSAGSKEFHDVWHRDHLQHIHRVAIGVPFGADQLRFSAVVFTLAVVNRPVPLIVDSRPAPLAEPAWAPPGQPPRCSSEPSESSASPPKTHVDRLAEANSRVQFAG